MIATRRALLQQAPAWIPRLAFAPRHRAPRGDVLLCIFLRGAADALNIVVPHREEAYYRLRPTLAVPRPDARNARADLRVQDLDGFFGLHPALAPLLPAWQTQHLAIVHACGAPDESRSHFQAMELMERGVATLSGPASGWLGRHLASLDTGNDSPLRAVGVGEQVPRALQGSIPAAALRSIRDFHLGGDPRAVAQMQAALAALYADDPALGQRGLTTLDTLDALTLLDAERYVPSDGASYPDSDLGRGLRQIAMLIKAEVGLEVACLDVGDWDTHIAQGGSEGWMATLLTDLAAGLSALHTDLQAHLERLLVITLSEFGRRVQENGGLGTDHGHGSLMLLLGGGVVGGRVHGRWPGLEREQLVGPGDLAVTTDYRDILGEIVQKRLNNPLLGEVFPGYAPTFRGVVG